MQNQSGRRWQQIASEMKNETHTARLLHLAKELQAGIDAEFLPNEDESHLDPRRSWHEIAKELSTETDPKRIEALIRELETALRRRTEQGRPKETELGRPVHFPKK